MIVGRDCRIGAHASLNYAVLVDRVYVYSGARIGQEGFGFGPTITGLLTAPQLGRFILEDDVEVGANTTIDRGSMRDTVIGAGSRLDNLVQIGHNVVLVHDPSGLGFAALSLPCTLTTRRHDTLNLF